MKKKGNKTLYIGTELTLAMKLAASFATAYYCLSFAFSIISLSFYPYFAISEYTGETIFHDKNIDLLVVILNTLLYAVLIFSLISIFCKKNYGKKIFIIATLLLILSQVLCTGFDAWLRYILEIVLLLIITPIREEKKSKPIKEIDTSKEASIENHQ